MLKKSVQLFSLLFAFAFFSSFYKVSNTGITVAITNLRNNKGHVLISLFKEGEGYPNHPEKAFRVGQATISGNMATITFAGVPAGSYAVIILHDQNDDQKMNTNFFGLPREGYGFSNNVMGLFGPPGYSSAKFTHTGSTTMQIKTRY